MGTKESRRAGFVEWLDMQGWEYAGEYGEGGLWVKDSALQSDIILRWEGRRGWKWKRLNTSHGEGSGVLARFLVKAMLRADAANRRRAGIGEQGGTGE